MPVGKKPICRFGPFEFDPECGQLRKDGVGLKIQGQPLQILEILLAKPGQLVTREELRQRLLVSQGTVSDESISIQFPDTATERTARFITRMANMVARQQIRVRHAGWRRGPSRNSRRSS